MAAQLRRTAYMARIANLGRELAVKCFQAFGLRLVVEGVSRSAQCF